MSALGDWLRRMGHTLVTGARDVDDNSTRVLSTWEQIEADTKNIASTLQGLKALTFDPKWKSRVINVPRAIEGIQDVYDIITHGFRDKYFELFQAVQTLKTALGGGLHHLPPNPEGSGIMTKVVDIVGQLDVAWKDFGVAYHKLTELTEMIADVKHRIETLDDLFLPQGSTKKTVDEHYRKRIRST